MLIFSVIVQTLFIAICCYGGARVALIMHERDKKKEKFKKGCENCERERERKEL